MENNPLQKLRSFRGFTLVELLIVMTIVGTLLSLVGPLAIDSLSKAQSRSEILSLKKWVMFQSHKAFVTSERIKIILQGNKAIVEPSPENKKNSMEFDYLFFQPQVIEFNQHGLSVTKTINTSVANSNIEIELDDWEKTREL